MKILLNVKTFNVVFIGFHNILEIRISLSYVILSAGQMYTAFHKNNSMTGFVNYWLHQYGCSNIKKLPNEFLWSIKQCFMVFCLAWHVKSVTIVEKRFKPEKRCAAFEGSKQKARIILGQKIWMHFQQHTLYIFMCKIIAFQILLKCVLTHV